jgi:hypothetical protein
MRFNTVFILLFTSSCFAAEPLEVSVGMYDFAPFVESKGLLGEVGMTLDLVAEVSLGAGKISMWMCLTFIN